MQEWMTVIDAVIQGVPEEAQKRRQTITHHYSRRGVPATTTGQEIGEEDSRCGMTHSTSSQEIVASTGTGGAAAYAVNDS